MNPSIIINLLGGIVLVAALATFLTESFKETPNNTLRIWLFNCACWIGMTMIWCARCYI